MNHKLNMFECEYIWTCNDGAGIKTIINEMSSKA